MIDYQPDPLLWIMSCFGLVISAISLVVCIILARRSKRESWAIRKEFLLLAHDIEASESINGESNDVMET